MLSLLLITVLQLSSLAMSCTPGELLRPQHDRMEVCVYHLSLKRNWLPLCQNPSEHAILCKSEICGKHNFHLDIKNGYDDIGCCALEVVIRSDEVKNNSNTSCMNGKNVCPGRDIVFCSPHMKADSTVEYILGGCIVVMFLLGMFLGWFFSYYYLAIRKPRIGNNVEEMIQTRLESNTYALIVPSYSAPTQRELQTAVRKKSLIPETSSLSNGGGDSTQTSDNKLQEGSKNASDGDSLKTLSQPQEEDAFKNTADKKEGKEYVQLELLERKEGHLEIPNVVTDILQDKQNVNSNTDEEVKEAEAVSEQDDDVNSPPENTVNQLSTNDIQDGLPQLTNQDGSEHGTEI